MPGIRKHPVPFREPEPRLRTSCSAPNCADSCNEYAPTRQALVFARLNLVEGMESEVATTPNALTNLKAKLKGVFKKKNKKTNKEEAAGPSTTAAAVPAETGLRQTVRKGSMSDLGFGLATTAGAGEAVAAVTGATTEPFATEHKETPTAPAEAPKAENTPAPAPVAAPVAIPVDTPAEPVPAEHIAAENETKPATAPAPAA
ncbi:hypothetical protein F5Y18DRAFT_432500 [Xylariaceae sp. FL1019]|nr:hypothetical protein F5Y18DRAFT_432500 [Xylariaceae sp. FL1019]